MASGTIHRVLLVTSELRCGGAERVVVLLASTLRTLGVDAKIICLQNPGSLVGDAEAAGIEVIALRSLRGYDVGAVCSLARNFRRFRPDVINVHDRSSLPYVVLANSLSGRRPVVFSAHGLLVRDERPRLRDCLAARGVAQVTAVSQPAAEEYARLLGWRDKIEVIDNGVPPIEQSEELRRQLRRSLGLDNDTFVYLAVGNVKPEKGFEDLLAAATILRQYIGVDRLPSPGHHEVVVAGGEGGTAQLPSPACGRGAGGEGGRPFAVLIAGSAADQEYHTMLLERQKELGLDKIVRFLGSRSDLQALYSAADAFVLSSRKEGLPMALLEAMSAGLPVAATEVGAVSEVIRRDIDGLLVPPASADLLADVMLRLASDTTLRDSLACAARARIEDRYQVRRMAEQYLKAYENAARLSVLMLGPLPPLTGGMATVTCNLRDSDLRDWCKLETLNNGKLTAEGRPFLVGVWAQTKLLWKVLRTIHRRRVRLVHIHTCALFSFWRDIVHMAAVRLVGCRVVWHLHDGTFPRFISEGSGVKRAVIRWALRQGAATIVLTDETLELLRPHAPGVRWCVVANGVPFHEPRRKQRRDSAAEADEPLRLLFLGNLTRRKGAYDLIAAVEAAAVQGVRTILLLAGGETSPGGRQEIECRIAESPVADQIRLLGTVHGEGKRDALDDADCIVLPSYVEALPMALLEGMAAELPAIATRVGSIPSLINDGVEGFLVSAGDVAALAERISRLAKDPELRRSMGHAARARVENHFSQRAMAERVYRVYLEAVSGTR